jgi:RNA polymerase sigma-70 factor (ECF subfamily)
MIPFVPPLVPGVVHELAHERDPQTAGLAVVERAAGVRRGSEQRVERICSIYDLHRHELVVDRERQVDRGPPTSETVTHNIRKDLVERQQEPPRGALREVVRAAELLESLDRLADARKSAGHGERLDHAHQPARGGSYHLVLTCGPHQLSGRAGVFMAEPDEDVVCVARCLRGDSSAFEALVRRYQRVLFSVAHRMLGNYEDAMDATQNAFVRAYERLDTYDPNRRFFSWIYRIAVNECLNVRRARRPGEPLSDQMEAAHAGGPLENVEAMERSELIDSALVRLSEEHRLVVVLRHFAELSYSEISEAIGVPEKTVKSRLFEARQRLGELLGPQPGGR